MLKTTYIYLKLLSPYHQLHTKTTEPALLSEIHILSRPLVVYLWCDTICDGVSGQGLTNGHKPESHQGHKSFPDLNHVGFVPKRYQMSAIFFVESIFFCLNLAKVAY